MGLIAHFALALFIASNLIAAVMLGCMAASVFVNSSMAFRLAVGVLAGSSLGCFFLGLDNLLPIVRALDDLAPVISFVVVAKSVALAVLLVLMRLRQAERGLDEHPRHRRTVLG